MEEEEGVPGEAFGAEVSPLEAAGAEVAEGLEGGREGEELPPPPPEVVLVFNFEGVSSVGTHEHKLSDVFSSKHETFVRLEEQNADR